VEPLDPGLREALKRAHPKLTDRDIDRFEALLVQQASLDPSTDREEIGRLDRERADMVKRLMPHYAEVAQAFLAQRRRPKRAERPNVRTTIKRPEP
jgi:hypothetical protein